MKFSLTAAAVVLLVRGVVGQLVPGVPVGPTSSLSDKSGTICNVLNYGAVADGKTDIGVAITNAFSQCIVKANGGGATLLVPEGEYLSRSFTFPGYPLERKKRNSRLMEMMR